jgi:hypothetical protein
MHPKGGAKQGRENRSWNKDESVAYFFEATTRRNYCKKLQKTHSYLMNTSMKRQLPTLLRQKRARGHCVPREQIPLLALQRYFKTQFQ